MFLIPNSDSFGEMGLLDEPEQTSEVRECDANGECADCKKKRLRKMKEMGPGKVHSAKFDRCVKHVEGKGKVDNAYAVCMSSLGKGKALKQGHGGRAVEVNHCHGAGKGHPCGGGSQKVSDHLPSYKKTSSTSLADSRGKPLPPHPDDVARRKLGRSGSGDDSSTTSKTPHQGNPYITDVTDSSGKTHAVHSLGKYNTPYFYSPAHGGPAEHFQKIKQLRSHIDRTEKKRAMKKMKASGAFNRL